MVRNSFIFFKNIESRYICISIFDCFENNFIFFKKFNKTVSTDTRFIKLKKIIFNKQCVNILYF